VSQLHYFCLFCVDFFKTATCSLAGDKCLITLLFIITTFTVNGPSLLPQCTVFSYVPLPAPLAACVRVRRMGGGGFKTFRAHGTSCALRLLTHTHSRTGCDPLNAVYYNKMSMCTGVTGTKSS
jgi:hypothetical protein